MTKEEFKRKCQVFKADLEFKSYMYDLPNPGRDKMLEGIAQHDPQLIKLINAYNDAEKTNAKAIIDYLSTKLEGSI